MSEDDYKLAVKAAKKRLFNDYRAFKADIRKHRLLREQSRLNEELKEIGVVRKQIPVLIESRTHHIKVRVV